MLGKVVDPEHPGFFDPPHLAQKGAFLRTVHFNRFFFADKAVSSDISMSGAKHFFISIRNTQLLAY